ncbi:MAG: hypothetical protein M9921_08580 [Fimbriimonadaceae bacterium]|nr:hypothetical protein [Chthonomonadaceae bacterium]MCO5296899.1 hypothetical protein [Fimbriimonadaceae bacterium]
MALRFWTGTITATLMAYPLVAAAQSPFNVTPDDSKPGVELGGEFTTDLITLRASGPGVPLRFGGVIPNTERLLFDGQVLRKGVDYSIDYAAGVVYLMRAQKAGQTLSVTYRHEAGRVASTSTSSKGFAGMKYDLVPGGVQAVLGLGMTERRADGSVLTTNQYGLNNAFKFGSGSLKGLFLIGEKEQSNAQSLYEYQGVKQSTDVGRSQFLMQNLQTKLGGGTFEVGYQDISKNFSAFGAVADAGYDAKVVDQLQKERGLTRTSLSMKDVGLGSGVKISNGFRSVEDDGASIDWQNFGVQTGGLSLSYDSQSVDAGFKRFKDLGEADRDQLKKEAGMTRKNFAGSYKSSLASMNFAENRIEDPDGNAIVRRTVGLDAGKFKFNLGQQEVEREFNRINSLFAQEKQQFGPELGLKRQWMSVEAEMFRGSPIKFATQTVDSDTGAFKSSDIDVKGSGWSLQHAVRDVDPGFGSLGALPASEIQEHIDTIANMYDKGAKVNPNERNQFIRLSGIERSFTRVSGQPFKNWNATFDTMELKGQQDDATVRSFALGGKDFQANYRSMSIGQQFSELGSLMNFEKQRLGLIAGLDRTDFGLNFKVGGTAVAASQMKAETPDGGASRNVVTLNGKGLDVSVTQRSVDPGFSNVNQLIDPEKDLLNAIKGFDQRDIKAKWQILPNLQLEALWYDSSSDSLDQDRMMRNTALSYKLDPLTQFDYVKQADRQADPLKVLFSNVTERFSVSRNFGRYGTLRYLSETREFDGLLANLPDSTKQYLAYETKLDPKTSLKTEQTVTQFDNGDHENISANTVSTEVAKGAGVSVSQVNVDRTGQDHDETKRNYGFWVDLGGGVRFSYGYARHLNGDQNGTQQKQIGMTPGTIGGLQVGSATYNENRWDDTRTQSVGNVQLSTAKPLTLGFLSDVKFNFGIDTSSDRSKWLKENRLINFTGKIGANSVGYEYKSQMHPTGYRGIDRMFSFSTDQNEKLPFRASMKYKLRTLPWDEQVMIRDYSLTARPAKNVELTHQLLTNPEVAKGDSILGSITQASRVNRWKLDVKQNADLTIGGSWDELINDQNNTMVRTGGLNLTLFGSTGSPLQLFFGVEESDKGGSRSTINRYHIRFDQHPGPNQTFSFFAGNVSYQKTVADGLNKDNWTIRMDYQIRF